MLTWESPISGQPESTKSLPAAPPMWVPWRCANCGTEGAIAKAPTASETMRMVDTAHARVAPECASPRFVAISGGRATEVRV